MCFNDNNNNNNSLSVYSPSLSLSLSLSLPLPLSLLLSKQVAACRAMTLMWNSSEWRVTNSSRTTSHNKKNEGRKEGGEEKEEGKEERNIMKHTVEGTDKRTESNSCSERAAKDPPSSSDNHCAEDAQKSGVRGESESPLPKDGAMASGNVGCTLPGCYQGTEGPLLAALLTKLERLLDQVHVYVLYTVESLLTL